MKKSEKTNNTPLMQQYFEIKTLYPEALLLFQVGDFYELFFDDAQKAAAFLGITLTTRGKNNGEPIPLCGVPVHALDFYLVKLVKGGFHVAVCDQLEEAVPGKIVKRGVKQVFTPGTLTDAKMLDEKAASYLLSIVANEQQVGLLFGELLTAQLYATAISYDAIRIMEGEVARFSPDEIIVPDNSSLKPIIKTLKQSGYPLSFNRYDNHDEAPHTWLHKQFSQDIVSHVRSNTVMHQALINFYWYIYRTHARALSQFNTLHFYEANNYVMIDASTQRNLELVKNNQDGTRHNTLCALLDESSTAMGSRMIKKWVVRPLLKNESIEQRHDLVSLFVDTPMLRDAVRVQLSGIGDIERIVGRIALDRASLYDYQLLTRALNQVPELCHLLFSLSQYPLFAQILSVSAIFKPLMSLLNAAIADDINGESIIKKGFDQHLDEVRVVAHTSNERLLNLEQQEQERTGIASLKVRYNQVHGYYYEITKANIQLVPSDFIRTQTLVGKERFTNQALKSLEYDILKAQQELGRLEQEVFERIKQELKHYIPTLRTLAHLLAQLDALASFATVSYHQGYVRPRFSDEQTVEIVKGKHPVIAKKIGNRFIPNDTVINDVQRMMIITGPNMGGKSTYLRQNALIAIMAQSGCYVPAQKAVLPLFNQIFTRIGAGDNVADGKSTFLVEMEETASICANATQKSLIILDEVGRGTSTYDGLAIAQAVVEYLTSAVKASCLFATHYHELTNLASESHGIAAYHAASKKTSQGILLLYKILKGSADGSFGIDVARLANLPAPVIVRAQELLETLQSPQSMPAFSETHEIQKLKNRVKVLQEKLNETERVFNCLKGLDVHELTPKMAFDLIWDLHSKPSEERDS